MFIKPSMATSATSYPCDQKTLNINADTKKTKSLADLARDALKQAPLKEKLAPFISYEESNVSDPKAPVIKLPKEIILRIFSYLNPDEGLAISKGFISYKTEASFSATWILKALNEGKMNKALTLIQNKHLEFNSKNLEGLWQFITNRESSALKIENFDFKKIEKFVKKAILKHPDLLSNDQLLRAASYFGLVNFIPNILMEPSSKQPLPFSQKSLVDALSFACNNNHPEIVKLLLIDKRVNPASGHNTAIREASEKGHLEVVRLLLVDNRVNPADDDNTAIRDASANGHLEIVRLLLADNRVNPADQDNYAIRWASKNGHFEVVRLLLADNRVNPADENNCAICVASQNGHFEVVRLLLADNRVNPAAQDNYAIRWASKNGHFEVVRLLLADNRVNPAVDDNNAIRFASHNGHFEIVRLLLADNRVNPAAQDNNAIRWASHNGHFEIVRLLLDDNRVNPADVDNEAICWASENGHFEIVRLLLADVRVNPADIRVKYAQNFNYAIRWASRYGHLEVVRLLLADNRVNPAALDNEAIGWASRNGHFEIVSLLLADSRVYAPVSYKEVFLNTINRGYSRINGPNEALSLAIQKNRSDVVKVLLADSRTNPATCKINEGSAIECAIDRGYSEMVKILLADSRVAIPRNALKLVQLKIIALEKEQAANISLDEATRLVVKKKNYQDIIELLDYHTHLNDLSFNILMTNAVSRLTSGLVAGSGVINSVYQRARG